MFDLYLDLVVNGFKPRSLERGWSMYNFILFEYGDEAKLRKKHKHFLSLENIFLWNVTKIT